MTEKTSFKSRLFFALFAVFFAISSLFLITTNSEPAYATPETSEETKSEEEKPTENKEETEEKDEEHDTCAEQAGAMYWIVCPLTKTIAGAVDSMYSLFDDILEIKPFSSDQNSPIRLVWNYVRNITNIIFIIILLIVVYSQLTGLGINNFGIKRILPRLIIAAILVNLSWIICSLAIDLSNVIGISLRGVFTNIKDTALAAGTVKSQVDVDWASLLGGIVTGGTVAGITIAAVGGLGALFWMLIPILLGALVSVLAGVITVAARQAVVALLLMISPLAFVAYLIPNTEKWFEKWKKTLIQMLIFFPTFSFLFGASELIGWTIITSATNGFGLILGMAVQVFPLFFAFSLMKMSGTALAAVNNTVRKMSSPVQKGVGKYSDSERELRRQKYLASKPRNFQLSKRLAQKVNDDSVRRAEDTKTYAETALARGKAKSANYRTRRGTVSRRGEELYEMQARRMDYQRIITRTANDFEAGLGVYGIAGTKQADRLNNLDQANIKSSDRLKYEQERTAKIDYDNAIGFNTRTQTAIEAHTNAKFNLTAKSHEKLKVDQEALDRYSYMLETMHGNTNDIHFIGAGAANSYDVQNKVISGKFSKYFALLPPTQQLHDRLLELSRDKKSSDYIDPIVTGMQILNQRGDTDLVKLTLDELLDGGKIELGTHASQSIASFLMFDVKDNDPLLRRFGKYINLETAHVFNHNDNPAKVRHNRELTFDEYITGVYPDTDQDGNEIIGHSKRPAAVLLNGTSLDGVERTAFGNLDASLRKVYGDDIKGFAEKRNEIQTALWPAFISANLKYLSGSEQISSAATFLTGLEFDAGSNTWTPRWNSGKPSSKEPLVGLDRKFFLDQTKTYLGAQTPNQIFNLRTDLLLPMVELFSLECDEEYKQEYLAEHPNTSPENIPPLSKEERKKRAYAAIRKVSDDKGTLEQMYLTRRSGAANNSKAMVREIYGLDDEEFVNKVLTKKRAERKAHEGNSSDMSGDIPSVWTPEQRTMLRDDFSQLLQDDPNSPTFFDETYKAIKEKYNLGVVAYKYKEYHDHDSTANNDDLLLKIFELLDDDENF